MPSNGAEKRYAKKKWGTLKIPSLLDKNGVVNNYGGPKKGGIKTTKKTEKNPEGLRVPTGWRSGLKGSN